MVLLWIDSKLFVGARILNSGTNFVGVLRAFGFATQITGQIFGFFDDSKAGGLDCISMGIQFQVSQHHDSREKQSCWIGQVFASNIGCGTMDLQKIIDIHEEIHKYEAYCICVFYLKHSLTDSNNAPFKPILPDGVRPRPPTKPAHISDKISPYKLGIT